MDDFSVQLILARNDLISTQKSVQCNSESHTYTQAQRALPTPVEPLYLYHAGLYRSRPRVLLM